MTRALPQPTPPPTDAELIAAFHRGDPTAFDALYDRWRGPATGYAARMLGDAAEAEEICTDAFVGLLEGRRTDGGSFSGWLFTVVHRRCLDRLRRRTGWRRLLPLLGACVFVLLAVTWATSAGDLLADR